MGRSTTPPYRIEIVGKSGMPCKMAWRLQAQYGIPGYGKPTNANLAKWVAGFNESMQPGGANAHVNDPVQTAKLVRQSSGETVATYTA